MSFVKSQYSNAKFSINDHNIWLEWNSTATRGWIYFRANPIPFQPKSNFLPKLQAQIKNPHHESFLMIYNMHISPLNNFIMFFCRWWCKSNSKSNSHNYNFHLNKMGRMFTCFIFCLIELFSTDLLNLYRHFNTRIIDARKYCISFFNISRILGRSFFSYNIFKLRLFYSDYSYI